MLKYQFLIIMVCYSCICMAQGGHSHGGGTNLSQMAGNTHSHAHKKNVEPPHGGVLLELGKYELEVLLNVMEDEEKFNVFLLKPNLTVIDAKEITGSATFRYKEASEITTEFRLSEKGNLYCNMQDIINPFVVMIKITYKGKEYTAIAEYAGLTEHLKQKQN